jgi:UDP-2-acetamido-2,6-beta-L-arabino-hexul-4-ose reductase
MNMSAYVHNKVIGSGMIGSAFSCGQKFDYPVLFFASGVSNSKCTNDADFSRELDLINDTINSLKSDTLFVYFSSCGVRQLSRGLSDRYLDHKRSMEKRIACLENYLIVRLPQVAGFSVNSSTLLNYLRDSIVSRRRMVIQRNAVRNIIDIDDVVLLTVAIIMSRGYINRTIDVANMRSIKVTDLIALMELRLSMSAVFDLIDEGEDYPVDTSVVEKFIGELSINFDHLYIDRVIAKYY